MTRLSSLRSASDARRPLAKRGARAAKSAHGLRRPQATGRTDTTSHSVIFDVEGTLVDCASQITESWRRTLQEAGHAFSHAGLHRYSGMDPDDMLAVLLPAAGADETHRLKQQQSAFYRTHFLPNIKAFPGVRDVFERLRDAGHRLGLATTCDSEELTGYLDLTGVGHLIEAVACGDDRTRGKPHPDLFKLALARLDARKNATAVGDTPYDAISAGRAGIRAIGTLGGGFSARELEDGGCRAVVRELSELIGILAPA
jgi:HAD superfamily hydrolase (TIGR01549 family)